MKLLWKTLGLAPLMATLACSDSSANDDNLDEADALGTDDGTDDESTSGDGDGDGDTFDDESDTAETADETTETGDDCGEVFIEPVYVPPNVMLVVDASGSMVSNSWDHDQDMNTPVVTRWNTLVGVVDIVMTNFAPAINAGLQRFPSDEACPNPNACYNSGACAVNDTPEVEVALDNAAAIIASIPGPDAISPDIIGGTPATAGVVSARDHLLTQDPAIPNYILLITDGAANCGEGLAMPELLENYDEGLQITVGDAFDTDLIGTFVVGIDIQDALTGTGIDGSPAANAYEELNEVAVAGGWPKNMGLDPDKFYNTQNQQELLDAIELILGEVASCVIDLTMMPYTPPEPAQIPFVSFEVDGVEIPYVEDCDTEDGWTWIVVGEIVAFCGSYCEDLQAGTASVDGTYGCPPPE